MPLLLGHVGVCLSCTHSCAMTRRLTNRIDSIQVVPMWRFIHTNLHTHTVTSFPCVLCCQCTQSGVSFSLSLSRTHSSKIIDGRSIGSSAVEEQPNHDGITVNTRSKLEIVVSHADHLNPITCEAANVAMRTPINKSTEISVLCECHFIVT